jgi:hypothetical protein
MRGRNVRFVVAGAIAGILSLSFSGAVSYTSITVSWPFSGLFFAIIVMAAAAQDLRPHLSFRAVLRYGGAAVVLAVGVPVAFLLAAAVQSLLGRMISIGTGAVVIFFVLPGCAAIAFWAACLIACAWVVTRRWRAVWVAQAPFFTLAAFCAALAADFVAKGLWQEPAFVPLFVVGEEVASAVFLAVATKVVT